MRTLPVLASTYSALHRVERLLDGCYRVKEARSWEELERETARVGTGAMVSAEYVEFKYLARIAKLNSLGGPARIVLFAPVESSVRALLTELGVKGVNLLESGRRSLLQCLEAASLEQSMLRDLGRLRSAGCSSVVLAAFRAAVLADPPFTSVGKLSIAIGCSRRTLYKAWEWLVQPRTPKEMLDLVVLLRLVALRQYGNSWSKALGVVEIRSVTARRILRVRLGDEGSDFRSFDVQALRRVVESRLHPVSRQDQYECTDRKDLLRSDLSTIVGAV